MTPAPVSSESRRGCNERERDNHSILCEYMDRVLSDPEGMSRDIHSWAAAQGLLVDISNEQSSIPSSVAVKRRLGESTVPVVMAHGMGDR